MGHGPLGPPSHLHWIHWERWLLWWIRAFWAWNLWQELLKYFRSSKEIIFTHQRKFSLLRLLHEPPPPRLSLLFNYKSRETLSSCNQCAQMFPTAAILRKPTLSEKRINCCSFFLFPLINLGTQIGRPDSSAIKIGIVLYLYLYCIVLCM